METHIRRTRRHESRSSLPIASFSSSAARKILWMMMLTAVLTSPATVDVCCCLIEIVAVASFLHWSRWSHQLLPWWLAGCSSSESFLQNFWVLLRCILLSSRRALICFEYLPLLRHLDSTVDIAACLPEVRRDCQCAVLHLNDLLMTFVLRHDLWHPCSLLRTSSWSRRECACCSPGICPRMLRTKLLLSLARTVTVRIPMF